jgi:O-antigen/teichoic acid export membrane protein
MGISRAWSSDPLTIRYAAQDRATRTAATARAAGAALTVGGGAGLALVATGLIIGANTGSVLIVVGLALPLVLVQDLVRFALVMEARPRAAFANDALWLIVLLGAFAVWSTRSPGPGGAAIAWLVGGAVGGVVGLRQLGVWPRTARTSWWSLHRALAARYSLEFLIAAGTGSILTIGVAILGSTSDSAGFRGAQVLLGPLNIAIIGGSMLALPHMVRAGSRHRADLNRIAWRFSAVLATTVTVWGAALLVIPDDLGERLLGQSWSAASGLLPLFVWAYLAQTAASGPVTALRALGAARDSLRVRSVLAPLVIGAGVGGGLLAGTRGAAAGLAVANTVAIPLWWWAMRSAAARSS